MALSRFLHLLLLSMIVSNHQSPAAAAAATAAPAAPATAAPEAATAAQAAAPAAENASGFRSLLKRVDRELPRKVQIQRAIQRSHLRAKLLSAKFSNVSSRGDDTSRLTLMDVSGAFTLEVYMGSPLQPLQVLLDTGSDLFWVQCSDIEQNNYFDDLQSTTFLPVSCNSTVCDEIVHNCDDNNICIYDYEYGNGAATYGHLAADIVTLGSSGSNRQQFRGIAFGCADDDYGLPGSVDGVIGFGRGSISFYSQISATIGNRFSYCLQANTDTSPLFFGGAAAIQRLSGTVSTPIMKDLPSLYYVNLTSAMVDSTGVSLVPQAADGSDGTILDSGTTLTYIAEAVYDRLRDAFTSKISLPFLDGSSLNLGLCYDVSNNRNYSFPRLHLQLENALLSPPQENYFFPPDPEESPGMYCLGIVPNQEVGPNIIGNLMQQSYQILYDTAASTISFSPAQCDQL